MNYLLRRTGFYLIAAWVSITLNFFLPRMMPGDPASRLMGMAENELTPEQIEGLKTMYGLSDDPLLVQYGHYLSNLARGDFGLSLSTFPSPVTSVIGSGIYWTLLLGLVTLVIGAVVGTGLGIYAAWRRGGVVDSVLPPLLILVGSFPYFWLAMLGLYGLGFKMEWFPLRHAYGIGVTPGWTWSFVWSVLTHLVLPAGTVILVSVGGWMLGMRNTMIAVLSEEYISMAEARGLPQRYIMVRIAARNALLPTVTSFGMAFGFIVSGSLLTEIVFSYPGLGYLLINAVRTLDYPLLQGILLIITLSVLVANFAVDLLYARLDPRVRVR